MPRVVLLLLTSVLLAWAGVRAQLPTQPNWAAVEDETLRHYQSVLRFDTSTGGERRVAEYVKQVLDREGIPAQIFALDPNRANVVARLKGNGRKRPLLIMGHSDVVTVDATKWLAPPFSAARQGGYIYARGTVDDKDNLTAALMAMILLKRSAVPLDRDVIFLSEAGEEGATSFGIDFMVEQHFSEIDAEYCIAEGGGVTRIKGEAKYATVETTEKVPRGLELVARGVAGHGSVPLKSNAVVRLAGAVARIGEWRPEIRLNETTSTYFRRLAAISPPETAKYYRDVASADPAVRAAADDWLFDHEPRHSSMLRTSVSPNIFTGGYRYNVIPSEARARLDVRMLPDEDSASFIDKVKAVIDDPTIEVRAAVDQSLRPAAQPSRLDAEPFQVIEAAIKGVYNVSTLPEMSTGATDMAQLRAKGLQCFGIGPAIDEEDGPSGFGAHSDQERLLESELYRFVRLTWEVVVNLAVAK